MAADVYLLLSRNGSAIAGESQDPAFRNCMELTDFSVDTDIDLRKSVRVQQATTGKLGFIKRQQTLMEKLGSERGGNKGGEPKTVKGYQGWMDQISVDDEAQQVDHLYFSVTKVVDTASPFLFLNYCQVAADKADQNKFSEAVISLRKPGSANFVYLKLTFTDVYVVTYSVNLSDPQTNTPVETVKFCCATYKLEYTGQAATGAPDASSRRELGWDFVGKLKL
jgi:type VI protein secretion system component Hcp